MDIYLWHHCTATYSTMKLLLTVTVVAIWVGLVEPHGMIIDPLSRTNLWQNPNFPNQPPNWCPSCLECGGNAPQDIEVSQCGMCGDPLSESSPRSHEHGGTYGRGFISKNYTAGSVIEIKTKFEANHYGYYEFHLCSNSIESPGCFSRLQVLSASERTLDQHRVCVTSATGNGESTARVQLPSGVRCNRCTLRWTYRTNYPGYSGWQECNINPHEAQVFRNCADISIN